MPLRLLIAPDKFKGTLAAGQVAQAIAAGWRTVRPQDSFQVLPITDGGDGFGEIVAALLGARGQACKTVDAAHRPMAARWWWEPKSRTAIIESARVIGLAMLPPGAFHPFELDTLGLAAVMRAAAEKGAARCLVGIGGSATNDGGFGLARGLGWSFRRRDGSAIERWTDLEMLSAVRPPRQRRWFKELVVAVDVHNPLLGPRGATRVYGPQKGLRGREAIAAERCLRSLARVVAADLKRDFARLPGSGAAGGLGFGLLAFLGARLDSGFELFAHHAELERHLREADVVITGEGCIDRSTLMGKGVGRIAQRCRRLHIPCIGLAGAVAAGPKAKRTFEQLRALTELTSVQEAKANPAFWLERLVEETASKWASASE